MLPSQKKRLKPALCFPNRNEIKFNTSPIAPAPKKMILAIEEPMYCDPVPVKRTMAIKNAIAKNAEAMRLKIMRSMFVQICKVVCLAKSRDAFQYGSQLQQQLRQIHVLPEFALPNESLHQQ